MIILANPIWIFQFRIGFETGWYQNVEQNVLEHAHQRRLNVFLFQFVRFLRIWPNFHRILTEFDHQLPYFKVLMERLSGTACPGQVATCRSVLDPVDRFWTIWKLNVKHFKLFLRLLNILLITFCTCTWPRL